jgi:hypothetical protein
MDPATIWAALQLLAAATATAGAGYAAGRAGKDKKAEAARSNLQQRLHQLQTQQAQINPQTGQKEPGVTPIGLINPGEDTMLFQQYFPNQQRFQDWALQAGQQGLQNTPLDFGPLKERYLKEFSEQTLPGILESYGAGRMTGERSSAFPQILGRAQSDLATNLGGLETQYNLAKHGLLQNLASLGNQPRVQSVYQQPGPGFGTSLASGIGQGIGSGASAFATKYILG